MRKVAHLVLACCCMLLLAGCGPKGTQPTSIFDTPEHQYLLGMDALEAADMASAGRYFTRSLELEPDYPPALAGKGLLLALQDAGARGPLWDEARTALRRAERLSANDAQRFAAQVATIRALTAARPSGWLHDARTAYAKARACAKAASIGLPYYRTPEAADHFMGCALAQDQRFPEARETLGIVLACAPGRWHDPANALYARVQRIERAMEQFTITDTAKAIAVVDAASRADVAALLASEIHFGDALGQAGTTGETAIPADIADHPFRTQIMTLLQRHVRGLEPTFDPAFGAYLFHPEQRISRMELAFILEDLLIKLTGDQDLATRFLGQARSPYPDVAPTSAAYNAVMNAVTRNLLETRITGAFEPEAPVDGADLLLAVVRLRNATHAN